jgi:hypothetical protein
MVGAMPENNFNPSKIKFSSVSVIPEFFEASVAALATYENAGVVMTKNFKDKVFEAKGKKFKVEKTELWTKEDKVIIALDLTGSIKGTVYLSGIPKYDPADESIYFADLDYVLDTKNILLKTANWMAGNLILNKLVSLCRFPMRENLDLAKESLLFYMTNYSPMEGVYVNGQINSFEFEKLEINNSAIIAFLKIKGKVSTSISGNKK